MESNEDSAVDSDDDWPLLSATDNTAATPKATSRATVGKQARKMKTKKTVHCRVHDVVELEPLLVAAMDTPQFQRLDAIQQLGGCSYVYPSATHTRKEHSIGVAHLAGVMVKHLRSTQPELGIDDDDTLCVQLAGLLHDVGHGPFSHMFEQFLKRRGKREGNLDLLEWEHEHMSERLVDLIRAELSDTLPWYFSPGTSVRQSIAHMQFVKLLIKGYKPSTSWPKDVARPKTKQFLCDIVANARNGLDVDKLDYLLRDCMSCFGSANLPGLSVHRIITSSRVLGDQICFEEKTALDIVEVHSLRARLHQSVYQHHTANVAELMITDVLDMAADHFQFRGPYGSPTTLTEAALDPLSFMMLTDGILSALRLSPSPELLKAQKILDRLDKRVFYTKVAPQVKLATLPLCPAPGCTQETQIGWVFCPKCSSSLELRKSVPKKDRAGNVILTRRGARECEKKWGRCKWEELTPTQRDQIPDIFKAEHKSELSSYDESHFKSLILQECAELGLSVDEESLLVHIVDYQHGKRVAQRDHWGKEWEVFDPFANVSFFNPKDDADPRQLDKKRVPLIRLPAEHRSRTLFCYVRCDSSAVVDRVQQGYLSWIKKMKGVSEQSGTSNTATPMKAAVPIVHREGRARRGPLALSDIESDPGSGRKESDPGSARAQEACVPTPTGLTFPKRRRDEDPTTPPPSFPTT